MTPITSFKSSVGEHLDTRNV